MYLCIYTHLLGAFRATKKEPTEQLGGKNGIPAFSISHVCFLAVRHSLVPKAKQHDCTSTNIVDDAPDRE